MVGSRLHVQLHRDSFNTPWGFRLQGGRDVNEVLTVRRVFSSSPAEGQLQRGDIILSVNNRDSSQLTHKEVQDLLKSAGGLVQLIINRPAPGAYISSLSPSSVTDRHREPSLQSAPPSAPPARPLTIQMAEPSFYTSYNGPQQQPQNKPPHQPLHVYATPGPQYQHGFERQRSSYSQPPSTPTPTTPVPPWAAQQFAPKRVSKLSKIGGGGYNFGSVYATLPRGTSAAQYAVRQQKLSQSSYDDAEEPEPPRLATGPIPKVCRIRNLGGGGYDFGSTFGAATLPRHGAGRRLSQPVKMPSASDFGYQPFKPGLNRYGADAYDAGPDYSNKGYGQVPTHRVQTSIDFTPASSRAPEVNASAPHYNSYESSHPPPQQVYTPTALLLEQQRLQEQRDQEEVIAPVWERRRQFQQVPKTEVRVPVNKSAPRVSNQRPAATNYANFGTDYSRNTGGQQPPAPWRPANQFKPAPAAVPPPPGVVYTPITVQHGHQPTGPSTGPKPSPPISSLSNSHGNPQGWRRPDEEVSATPAWRNTLKTTGVKPWETETGYALEQQPVSVKPSPSEANQSGDRDWSQSAVLQLISQEDSRKNKQPPVVAPKPLYSPVPPQQPQQHFYDEIGASDF